MVTSVVPFGTASAADPAALASTRSVPEAPETPRTNRPTTESRENPGCPAGGAAEAAEKESGPVIWSPVTLTQRASPVAMSTPPPPPPPPAAPIVTWRRQGVLLVGSTPAEATGAIGISNQPPWLVGAALTRWRAQLAEEPSVWT